MSDPTRTETSTAVPSGPKRRRRPSLPVLAGTLIAAAGLVLGGLASASAHHGGRSDPYPAPNAAPPKHGDFIPNVSTTESLIEAYYGTASKTYPAPIGTVTVPSKTSNYAHEVEGIESQAKHYLNHEYTVLQHEGGSRKPAVIFDIDDTTLNTYDYEIFAQFGYTPASDALFVDNAAFPAVFGMPHLINWANHRGYTVFFITGRPEAQRSPTVTNLADVGVKAPIDMAHLYLKQTTPPPYLHCAAAPSCTTIEYKSGTRAHIASLGYKIVADFGDQFSDLKGGHAGAQFKIPNPMYYLP
jgi:HAD superfamily, subfamily IIIB (Acid phosphatase)